jgi:hypothetical protein
MSWRVIAAVQWVLLGVLLAAALTACEPLGPTCTFKSRALGALPAVQPVSSDVQASPAGSRPRPSSWEPEHRGECYVGAVLALVRQVHHQLGKRLTTLSA